MSKTYFGKILNGKLDITYGREYLKVLSENEGKSVIVEIDPEDEKTKQQLGYLFGHVFKVVGDHLGYTPYEVYEIMLEKLPEVTKYHKTVAGKVYEFTKRLSTMNREEVGKFIDACVLYFRTSEATREILIQDPDPLWKS